jgi:hypothetical protein
MNTTLDYDDDDDDDDDDDKLQDPRSRATKSSCTQLGARLLAAGAVEAATARSRPNAVSGRGSVDSPKTTQQQEQQQHQQVA